MRVRDIDTKEFAFIFKDERVYLNFAEQIAVTECAVAFVSGSVWENSDWARSEQAWGEQEARIMAIAAGNGSELWEKQYPVAPLSLSADLKSVYFYRGTKMIRLNRLNGKENWKSEAIKRRAINTAYAPIVVVYDSVVLFSTGLKSMMALSVSDGKKLWEAPQAPSGHYSPEDIFVIDGLVWTGDTGMIQAKGTYAGRDLHAGEVKNEIPCDTDIYFFHQMKRIPFLDLAMQPYGKNSWNKTTCSKARTAP